MVVFLACTVVNRLLSKIAQVRGYKQGKNITESYRTLEQISAGQYILLLVWILDWYLGR